MIHEQTPHLAHPEAARLAPQDIIAEEAARCVQCAQCLPFCPTFRLSNSESESPRGRIALAAAIANHKISDKAAWRHLDSCVECHACTRMCPSKVNYDRLRRALHAIDSRPFRGLRLVLAKLRWLTHATMHWLSR
ncbi:MAG: (Fe-S)-binding protein [Gammaproteobacteria bacterium]|nr:(Fe-S)-binding protein [Gammaproteobacteria bacterium]